MSMPEFPTNSPLSRADAINMIIASIAMEELGISHIINAEGEKLQYVLGTLEGLSGPAATISDILEVNGSIQSVLQSAAETQSILRAKLQNALSSAVLTGPTGSTGDTGPTGPTGTAQTFLSSYLEALGTVQTLNANDSVQFDLSVTDAVGSDIMLNADGRTFTIDTPGLYSVEWAVNVTGVTLDVTEALFGLIEAGTPESGASGFVPGRISNGALIEILDGDTPYSVTLVCFSGDVTVHEYPGTLFSAVSMRILRFADGAN